MRHTIRQKTCLIIITVENCCAASVLTATLLHVFTVTFDHFKASMPNKYINLNPKLLNCSVT